MKKHNLLKVVAITMFVTVLLTWFIGGTTFNQTLNSEGVLKVGLFDLLNYSVGVVAYFGYVPLLLFAIGGFYGVLFKTKSYRNLIDKLVKSIKSRPRWIFLTVMIALFALLSSLVGQSLVLLFFFPFAITLVLAVGYDKITAVLATVGAVMVGYIGSTLSVSNIGVINQLLMLEKTSLLWWKVALLILAVALLTIFTVKRGEKYYDAKAKDVVLPEAGPKKAKCWPIVLTFALTFIIFVLAYLSWEQYFGVTFFNDLVKNMNEFKIGKVTIFKDIFGAAAPFGNWQIQNAPHLIFLATILVGLLSRVTLDDFIDGYVDGMKKALKPAVLVLAIYVILMISVYHPITLTMVKGMLNSKALNVFTLSLAGLISNLFASDILYSSQAVLPYVTSVLDSGKTLQVAGLNWQAIYGFSMLVVPTSVTLIATLSYLEVSYTKYIKSVWKFLIALLVLILVFMLLARNVII